MTTYTTLDIEIDNHTKGNGAAEFIKCQPDVFKQQFLFYRKDVGHSVEKSINRTMSETFEIYDNIIHLAQCALNDCNLKDNEKIETAISFLNDCH